MTGGVHKRAIPVEDQQFEASGRQF
jgi:hypothetical protein